MNKNEHLLISGILTGLRDVGQQNFEKGVVDWKQSIVSGFVVAIGGILADEIEPATNPNHRGFAHSWGNLALIQISENVIKENQNLEPRIKKILMDISYGYKIHLLADSTISKGLPLI